ncbi:MSMEG_0569 family flavin-dependent oxidoreductase [Marinoscillum sp. MHG1-6]|uniref:MSMEG_0569 family flavin-dependent oxidoreductase n=1 Tax=Marinoscillum sp. MHG1-6 TaxID=2959627 RepID=UPI0021571C62|nr:MSMEG_0569 family flavin-dependent oxidoreductase [Marinoscillum sp. MHG1-6]
MKEHYSVIIVGGGQAGLSISYCLKQEGIDHIIFEKNRIGYAWREKRWDAFCLVTPNWQCNLPGFSYEREYHGKDPKGFMTKDEIVRFIEAYAAHFNPPIHEGVTVTEVIKNEESCYQVSTSEGTFTCDQIVIAAGNFQFASLPGISRKFPHDILQIHSSDYKNPEALPKGDVMVVGTGQSGAQIAEDLHLAGKKVHLCVGNAPRTARNYRGKDVVEWLDMMKHYDIPITKHPEGLAVRKKTNHYVTGRDGGKEIDLREFALEGMVLYGKLEDVQEESLVFAPNLKENLDRADESAERIKQRIDQYIEINEIEAPVELPYAKVWEPSEEITSLDLSKTDIKTVIWSIGYGFDYSWVKLPVFDKSGYPIYDRGITSEEGLYFLGLAWMYTWGSGRFSGIAKDAEYLSQMIRSKIKEKILG